VSEPEDAEDVSEWVEGQMLEAQPVDREELAELVELEESHRHVARWESVNSLGFTDPEIRLHAASIAATLMAPVIAAQASELTSTGQVAATVIAVAQGIEPYLREHA
jgi:hypothetical protein